MGLDQVGLLHRRINLPIFCIGGVKLGNLSEIMRAGAKRVCIVSDLLCALDVPAHTAAVKAALEKGDYIED